MDPPVAGVFFTLNTIDFIIIAGFLLFGVLGFRRGPGEWSSVIILGLSWLLSTVGWYRLICPRLPEHSADWLAGLTYLVLVSLLVLVFGLIQGLARQLVGTQSRSHSFSGALAGIIRLMFLILIFLTIDQGAMRGSGLTGELINSSILKPGQEVVRQIDRVLRPDPAPSPDDATDPDFPSQ